MDSNFFVPDFGIEEEDSFSTVFDLCGSKTLTDPEEEGLAEIPWQKGPAFRLFSQPEDLSSGPPCDVFIGEDEMSSWLHCSPENPQSVENALVKPIVSPTVAPVSPVVSRASITPPVRPVLSPPQMVKASTMVVKQIISPTMAVPPSDSMAACTMVGGSHTDGVCEKVMASCSFGGTHGEGRKRKSHNSNDSNDEDVEYDSDDKKKDNRRQTRRSRVAEVHNLSERRRRDSINEKMKALQQLIPRCNKSDKASMLHDAVEYLKSLQYQIQMMSMGCTMNPMMFLGIPQYPAQMGMPMGMGVDPSSRYYTHPMLPFTPAQLPRMPMPMYNPAATVGQQIPQAANFMGLQGSNAMQLPNLANPYNPYFGLQHMQASPQQTQTAAEPGTSNGSSAPEKEF